MPGLPTRTLRPPVRLSMSLPCVIIGKPCDGPDRVRTVRDARYKYIRNFQPDQPHLRPMAYLERTNPICAPMRRLMVRRPRTLACTILL